MNTDLNIQALEILSQLDRTLYIDLTEPIRRGIGKVFFARTDGVLVYVNGAWMVAAQSAEAAHEIMQIINSESRDGDDVCVHGKECRQLFENFETISWYSYPCYVGAYLTDTVFDVPSELEIRRLDKNHAGLVSRTYTAIRDSENALETAQKMLEGMVFGGFLDNQCVGYVGVHSEGAMGMLEVLPEYRNRGFGTALEMFLINRLVSMGMVPFCHVWDNNAVSLKIQRMLGLKISDDLVYWGKLLTNRK